MKENISQGMTFQGFISTCGFIVTIAGLFALIFTEFLFLSIIASLIGVIFFLSFRGVLIDYDTMKIKPYLDILIYKIGTWHNLNEYEIIALKLFTESQTMNMASISNTHTTKTFNIYLQGNISNDLFLKEFTEYDKAKSFLEKYSLKLNKKPVDTFALMLAQRNAEH